MPRPVACRQRSPGVSKGLLLVFFMLVAGLIPPSQIEAQVEGRVYAIRDARLVTAPGSVIERGTIVLRGGLIEAVGADVPVPADAVLVDGEGLTVYPGFIDAFSQAGLTEPENGERESAANIAGRLASDRFSPESQSLTTYRSQGFTAALLARDDGVFAGGAVLINLLGENIPEMTVKAPVIQVMGYSGQPGYPGTLMAVVAYQRQTLIDAAYHQLLITRYERDPGGIARPPADPDLEALIPVAGGEAPVLAIVHKENDFKRLRNLSREYGIKFWIAGAEEAFRVTDLIRAADTPVIVSLNYPSIEQVTGYVFDRVYKNLSEEEKEALDDRDRTAVHGNAAAVFNSGVPLALATGGMRNAGDFLKNLRLAVGAGLPADEALRALTVNPARICGVDRVLGTLEIGKIANLTVVSGDIFTDEEAYVAHVFIDGRKDSFSKPEPRGAEGGSTGVSGEWMVEMLIEGELTRFTMTLSQEDAEISGSLEMEWFPEPLPINGSMSGNSLKCTAEIPEMGSLTITATVEGDTMSGEFGLGPMGSASFSARRNPPGIRTMERRAER